MKTRKSDKVTEPWVGLNEKASIFASQHPMHRYLTLAIILSVTSLSASGAEGKFEDIAKHSLAEIHAKHFQAGNIKECVSIYAADAKFFVDHKLVASGAAELLALYTGLRETDGVRKIEINEFVDIGADKSLGWVIFTYTKEYDLKGRDPKFIKDHKLEGFSTLSIKQYGTAIFSKIDGRWKIQRMSVFDPEIWEPKK